MTENSLKMRAMAYLAQAKAKLLTSTIYEIENSRKHIAADANEIANEKQIIEDHNEKLVIQLEYEKKLGQQKEELLWQQSKYAVMGEMLNMITHQWKQPLSAISNYASTLIMKNELGKLDIDSVDEYANNIKDQTQNMFTIIDDFMSFNKPEANTEFYLYDAYKDADGIITPLMINNSVLFDVNIDKNLKVFHNIKSLGHVLLNLINNAVDAFKDAEYIEHKLVKIYTTIEEDTIILHIHDNAGGIPLNILNKIFEPYVTTKEKGTGLGLWMSKKMVENIPGARLDVEVDNGHTHFQISFLKVEES